MTPAKIFKNTRSLAFYLSISVLSIVIVVFSLLITYNYYVSRDLLIKNVKENTHNLTSSAINKSEGFFNGIEKIAINSALFIPKNDYLINNTKSVLFDLLENNPEVYGSCIAYKPVVSSNDTLLNAPYCWKTNSGIQFKNLGDKNYHYPAWDWYAVPANEHRNVWSEPYYDKGGGNALMTTFSVPVYKTPGDTGSFSGVLTIDVSLKWLNEMLSSIKIFKSGFAFLISNKGNIISHPDTSLIMEKDIIRLSRELNDNQTEALAKKMLSGQQGFEVIDEGFFKEKSWIYYTSLKNNAWSLGFVFPESELYADLYTLNKRLIIILASGIFLLLIFIILLSGKITKPIRKLAGIMDKDTETFINMQIPETGGSSEITTLNKSFRSLQKELNKYITNLKEVTATKERIESEINIARKLQLSMLPDPQASHSFTNKIQISSFIKPAKEVGGDFYDYFFLDEKHLFFTIGDVSGKGMGAALFMSATITLLRAYAKSAGNDLCRTISLTSEYLCNNNKQQYFVTLFTGILNIECGEMVYINAGHNYPVIISNNSEIQVLNKTHLPPLGIIKRNEIKPSKVSLKSGDKIFLYTDGLTESMNTKHELFTTHSMIELLSENTFANSENIIVNVNEKLKQFTETAEQNDDITMLCLHWKCCSKPDDFHVVLKEVKDLLILNELRYKVEAFFEDSDTSLKTINRLFLVLEELITNVVKYGLSEHLPAEIEIRIHVQPEYFKIAFSDTGKEFDIKSNMDRLINNLPDSSVIGKRGLMLIRKMTSDLKYERSNDKNNLSFLINKN